VSRRTGTGWRAAMSTDANRRQSVVRTRRRHASRSTEAAQESARSSVTLHARQNSECPFRHRSDVHAGLATRDTMTGAHAEGLEQRARRLNRRETCTPGDFSLRRVRRQLALRERPSHLPQRPDAALAAPRHRPSTRRVRRGVGDHKSTATHDAASGHTRRLIDARPGGFAYHNGDESSSDPPRRVPRPVPASCTMRYDPAHLWTAEHSPLTFIPS
jgi:hypothetical protein